MKRMTEEKANQLLAYVAEKVDLDQIPLDDQATYDLLSDADTDGVFMMETEWDKYDLRQIRPQNLDELTACVALSHDVSINLYIYPYIKVQKVQPFTYPAYEMIGPVAEILKDSRGILLYKEQAEAIKEYLAGMSEDVKKRYAIALKILYRELETHKHILSNRIFFRRRALLCYKMAYVKVHFREAFDIFRNNDVERIKIF